ncbi:precorrin-3B C(17)-methyltransferase [Cyanobium sp. NIES-981]|uniref:precorrin-3B C(17)-methyltransferase n=1 Tax=Cyanobium sp. NIES-981 TaxID=1851505 RepID=UPI0007DDED88|nr:precorrin-3B C(17)-methyltransferase [Cyanobium sp. NIES-981]SBO43595.1 Bifunctional cbih protein and precorrin-3b c17-methyltransferase [Cyanobium sp. NIES-981]
MRAADRPAPSSQPQRRRSGIWGLSFSAAGDALLLRLHAAGVASCCVSSTARPDARTALEQHWDEARAFLVVGACGLVSRLIAPLLRGKREDPAVVVIDPRGRFAIPLLGAHAAGGEALAQSVAAILGGEVVSTGSSSGEGRLSLDQFGERWSWRRSSSGDWTGLMQRAARAPAALKLRQNAGCRTWLRLDASQGLPALEGGAADPPGSPSDLVITAERGPGCRWHPPCLWLGIGCERHTSLSLLERLVDRQLERLNLAPEAIAGLASIDRKADEPALLALASQRGWFVRWLPASVLDGIAVPNPSRVVQAEMGTASVAEAAALAAAGPGARLLLPKTIERSGLSGPKESGAATLAIASAAGQWAPQQGCLHLVGSGPGQLDLLTADARRALAESTVWVGYGLYLDLLEPLRRPDQWRWDGQLTQERERCRLALDLANQGLSVALVSSGDSGIYAMAGLALELWLEQPSDARPRFAVHPGISALQLAAARAGAPLMHDFCTISLSDRLTPWPVIERRLHGAGTGDFVVALYNPRSRGRDWQLARAREILLGSRPGSTPVVLARQLGRAEETVQLSTLADLPVEQVDMLTLVLIGNSSSYCKDGKMVTPRGYPGADLS